MTLAIADQYMSAAHSGRTVATARYSEHAAADGSGAWIASNYPGRLLTRCQAITALTLAEYLAAGHAEDDPMVIGWRAELRG